MSKKVKIKVIEKYSRIEKLLLTICIFIILSCILQDIVRILK